ncbi:EF-hand domain and EF-hand domain pair-containing protein [Strongyloides ratti]|uniref:EF-hand domain and EF-hand domain pair-containing protein n=1 Tax=Strongyloides ratti TaxID=34506 RepID=A0A090LS68_STRRB|nr:EF-hand domain and EF-hand domain pair-containing protein [Strongyloides ratti]CEF71057.1 EF-hand domain and EF-hand domain pair-containing protein [Strongyloides ratti]
MIYTYQTILLLKNIFLSYNVLIDLFYSIMAIPIGEDPLNQTPIIGYDEEYEEEVSPIYRPESLSSICKMTKFSPREIRVIYRAFKQGCPTGVVNLKEFQNIYAQFFPRSNSQKYAEFVFKTFDKDKDECLSFEDFVKGLSMISRGSPEEKLSWIFDLYDIRKKNCISPSDMLTVVHSIYELLGTSYFPPISKTSVIDQVIDAFNKEIIKQLQKINLYQNVLKILRY